MIPQGGFTQSEEESISHLHDELIMNPLVARANPSLKGRTTSLPFTLTHLFVHKGRQGPSCYLGLLIQ